MKAIQVKQGVIGVVALLAVVLSAGRLGSWPLASDGAHRVEQASPGEARGKLEPVWLILHVTDGVNPLGGIKVAAVAGIEPVQRVATSDASGMLELILPTSEAIHLSVAGPDSIGRELDATLPAQHGALDGELVLNGDGSIELRWGTETGSRDIAGPMTEPVRESDAPTAAVKREGASGDAAGQNGADLVIPGPVSIIPVNDPFEPDTCAAARIAVDGLTETRSIHIASDADFYQIVLACGDTIRVDVTPTTKELQALIDIYSDATCTTILTGGTAGTFGNGTPNTLLRTVTTAGTYRIRIRNNGGPTAGNSWGPYTVAFKVTAGPCIPPADAFETDSCTITRPLNDNLSEAREINPAADQDFYTFTWNCGEILRVAMIPVGSPNTLIPQINLYQGAQCTTVSTTVTGTAGQPALLQTVLINPAAAGIWTLRANSSGGTTSGFYRLVVSRVMTNLCVNDAFEPDDVVGECRPLPLTTAEVHEYTVSTRFNPLGAFDEEWFCVTLACGDRLTVRTYSVGIRDVATTVQVRDAAGVTTLATDSTGGGSSFSLVNYIAPTAGTYTVRVTGASIGAYGILGHVRSVKTPLTVAVTQTPTFPGVRFDAVNQAQLAGYTATTGANAPIDISATGTELSVGDDTGRGVPLGFSFKLYEFSHTSITVASNGYLTFGTTSTNITNQCPITTAVPNDLIGPMWDDWSPNQKGGVLVSTIGAPGSRQFIAQWEDVRHFSGLNTDSVVFQAILSEGTNTIEYRYGTLSGLNSDGLSATVGVKDITGTRSTVFGSCNTAGSVVSGVSRLLTPNSSPFAYPNRVGYTLTQPNSPIIDAVAGGTNLNLTDDSVVNALPIGFTFNFFGAPFTTISVDSNGYASLQTLAFSTLTNSCPLISTATPNALIAPFWEDMLPTAVNNVYYQTQGAPGSRKFIMEWSNVGVYNLGVPSGSYTFEIILNEGTDTIELRYGSMTNGAVVPTASVGVENALGTSGLQISCNAVGLPASNTSYFLTYGLAVSPTFTWKDNGSNATLATGTPYNWPANGTCSVRLETQVVDDVTGCTVTNTQVFTPCADLTISKSCGATTGTAGLDYTYSIAVTNAGPGEGHTVAVTDTLPAGTTFVSLASPAGWVCTTPPVGSGGTVSCTRATLATGPAGTFTLVVHIPPSAPFGSSIANTASIASESDPSVANNSSSCSFTVSGQADLQVTKTDSPDPVAATGNITYTITVTNAGPSDLHTATLSEATPANTTFVSVAAPAGWACVNPAVGGTGPVTCTNPTLTPGASVITLVVKVNGVTPTGTIITNTATVSDANPPDPNGTNNTATATTTVNNTVAADLSLTKTAAPAVVVTNSNVTYTLTLGNAGPAAATSTTVTDILPASLTFVSCSATGGGVCSNVGNSVTVTYAAVPVAPSAVVTIVARVNCGTANGASIPNTATVSAPASPDPVTTNNSSSASITASDPNPAITCPANITVNTTLNQCGAIVTYPAPVPTDNCPGVTFVCSQNSGTNFPKGTTTVTCTATDSTGHTAACSFTVTVVDNQNPAITCPAPVTASTAPGQCGAIVTYPAPVATDNCPGVTFTCSQNSGTFFPKGTTTVTCTATDTSAHTSTCSFTVTVNDLENPAITCPANVTANAAAGQCGAIVTYPAPVATDNCPGVTFTCSQNSGTFFPKGSTTVTCTATDAAARTATCSFTVTVIDNQPPAISCPANIVTSSAPGLCGSVVSYPAPVASDNCPGVTVVCSPLSGTFFAKGTTNVTCTATDTSALTSTCGFTVTVNDTEPPVVSGISVSPASLWPPNHTMRDVTVSYTATDNCPGAGLTCSLAVTSNEPILPLGPDWVVVDAHHVQLRAERLGNGSGRIYTIAIHCVDGSGNTSNGTATVTVPHNQ